MRWNCWSAFEWRRLSSSRCIRHHISMGVALPSCRNKTKTYCVIVIIIYFLVRNTIGLQHELIKTTVGREGQTKATCCLRVVSPTSNMSVRLRLESKTFRSETSATRYSKVKKYKIDKSETLNFLGTIRHPYSFGVNPIEITRNHLPVLIIELAAIAV